MIDSPASSMVRLLDAISVLVRQISPEKIHFLSEKIRNATAANAGTLLFDAVGSPLANSAVNELIAAWKLADVSAGELALMLLAAQHVVTQTAAEQSIELVWTGPTTPFVAARRTEQALLQVINGAHKTLYMTSFVAYDISSVVKALNNAIDRGVRVGMLLEASQAHGGNVSVDGIGKMRALVPLAKLYAWNLKAQQFADGSVHAKVAVADRAVSFITSANLTGYAMERNMEAGVLITGGHIPRLLEDHLQSLIETNVISAI